MKDFRVGSLEYVRYVLKETGLKASALAKLAGVSTTTLTRPLKDDGDTMALSFGTVEKIQRVTGIDPAPFYSDYITASGKASEMYHSTHDHYYKDAESRATKVVARIEAGVWREIDIMHLDIDFVRMRHTNDDKQKSSVCYVLNDESCDKILRKGGVLFAELYNEGVHKIKHGDIVIIERNIIGTKLVETTARRAFILEGNNVSFTPLSDDLRYQYDISLGDAEGKNTYIAAYVRWIMQPIGTFDAW